MKKKIIIIITVIISSIIFFNSCYKENERDLIIMNRNYVASPDDSVTHLPVNAPCDSFLEDNRVITTINFGTSITINNSYWSDFYQRIKGTSYSSSDKILIYLPTENLPTYSRIYDLVNSDNLNANEARIEYDIGDWNPILFVSTEGKLYVNVDSSSITFTFCELPVERENNPSYIENLKGKFTFKK